MQLCDLANFLSSSVFCIITINICLDLQACISYYSPGLTLWNSKIKLFFGQSNVLCSPLEELFVNLLSHIGEVDTTLAKIDSNFRIRHSKTSFVFPQIWKYKKMTFLFAFLNLRPCKFLDYVFSQKKKYSFFVEWA